MGVFRGSVLSPIRSILILDEIDFISRTPSALSEVYSLARKYPSTLRLIGISNTLTLGSEAASTPVTPTKPSRSTSSSTIIGYTGPERSLNFSAYTSYDLLAIITCRLTILDTQARTDMFNPVALNFLCKKVAASNGDVRFALSVLRRCVDTVEKDLNAPPSPSGASTTGKKGRVEMKHVLESLRAHENGGSGGSNTKADGTSAKGSGVSRTVRGLGLHARLAIVALLVGWKRIEAGFGLALQNLGSTPSPKSNAASDKVTSTTLYAFYVALLTAQTVDANGEMSASSGFSPISRGEFQDILGVLETSGLVSFTSVAPVFGLPKMTTSASSPSLSSSSSSTGSTPPKTPTRPRTTGRSTSLRNFSLPTPSRTPSMSNINGRRKSAGNANDYMVLSEGVREDEIIRGLTSAYVGSGEKDKGGVVEKEIERLWERELRRVRKEVERRERKKVEEQEKRRMDELAFDDD